jgi:hypothetical protein
MWTPRVQIGQNTSAVLPASRKRRWKGNPVVSDETVMYESSATPTTDRLHYTLQTHPLVREGALDENKSNCPAKDRKKKNLVMGSDGVPDTKMDRPTDRSQYQLNISNVK